jgi:hypothetical protein
MKKFIPLASLIFTGCTTFSSPADYSSLHNGSYWMNYDASRRGAFFSIDAGKISKTCSEQAPDVGLSFADAVKANVTANGITGGLDTTFVTSALALAGRDEAVLLAREALFRLCEANINGSIKDNEFADVFKSIMVNITQIAEAKKATAQAHADAFTQQLKLNNK